MIKTHGSEFLNKLFRTGALVAACAITAGLFYFGAQPEAVGLFKPPIDKLAHFGLFFVLASLFWLALAGRWPLQLVGFVTLLGALDEWRQAYLPGRSMDGADLLTDFVAVCCAVLLLVWMRRRVGRGGT